MNEFFRQFRRVGPQTKMNTLTENELLEISGGGDPVANWPVQPVVIAGPGFGWGQLLGILLGGYVEPKHMSD